MFQAGKSNQLTFKVNVMGTSSSPSVRVILGTDPEMSYPATNLSDDKWTAQISIPEGIEGTYNLRVEVVLNGRLFTPITKSVTIEAAPSEAPTPNETPIEVPTPPEAVAPGPLDQVEFKIGDMKEDAGALASVAVDVGSVPDKVGKPIRRPILPTIAINIDKVKPLKPKVTAPTQGLSMLKTFADKPAKKMHERIVTDMPKPGSVVATEKLSIASVDSIAGPVKAKIAETIAVAKAKKPSTIKLIKEQLYYE